MKKETFEWIHSWCDYTQNKELPRVLLIGDSICWGYNEIVREKLRGVCYVDFLSTSYAIDNTLYTKLVKDFVANSEYDLVHFNFGLHGYHISKAAFEKRMTKLLNDIKSKCKNLGLCLTTAVNKEGNKKPDPKWMKKVIERNEFYKEYALKNNIKFDDLYSISLSMPKEKRLNDGVHYERDGYELFANQIENFVKEVLKK